MRPGMITDVEQLRELYRPPNPNAAGKVTDRIDEASARFIALCPLVLLSTADTVLDGVRHPRLRRPRMALVVETAELFVHCAQAFRRGRVWDPTSWDDLADAPDLAEI